MMRKLAFIKKQSILTLKNIDSKEIMLYTLHNKLGALLMNTKTFENNEEKLAFILDHLDLKNSDIALKFGVTQGTISKMRTDYNSTLKPAYLYAFENVYGIPYKIFEDENINTEEQIIEILDEKKTEIGKELGDVLWYISQLATELGVDLDDVAQGNIDKLYSRMDRGVLQGSGDNR